MLIKTITSKELKCFVMMCMFADMNMCVYGTEIEIGCAVQLLFIFFL